MVIRRLAVAMACAGMACAGVITAAGCSSGARPADHAASAGNGQSRDALAAAHAITLAASQARQVTSFAATLNVRSTGSLATTLSGTLRMQTRPRLLADQVFHVTADGEGLPGGVETLLTSNAAYLKVDTLARVLGKPWVKVSISGAGGAAGINLIPLVQQVESGNPLAQIQMFAAAKDVRQAGSQVINGVQTTEYTGSYRAAAGLNRLDPVLRPLVWPALKATGISTTQFEVWIDGQHQVRKMTLVQSGKTIQVTSVMVVTMINQPAGIQVPPGRQVASAAGIP
jgi:hypothetical protein